ncbi:MAG: WD40 repeat domain-containing protein [Armatimonadetes bacterium]|nr:WD40 repeat domain-containing protein [Armatimonadota bacterium]
MISLALTICVVVSGNQAEKPLAELPYSRTEAVKYLRFSPNAKRLTIGTVSGELVTWDLASKRPVSRMIAGREVRGYAVTGSGQVFTLHADGSVAIRDAASGDVAKRVFQKGRVTWIGEAGGSVFAVMQPRGSDDVYQLVKYPDDVIFAGRRFGPVALSAAGDMVAIGLPGGKVSLYDPGTARLRRTLTVGSFGGLALSADGQLLAVTSDADSPILLFSTATGKQAARLTTGLSLDDSVVLLAFSPDGKYVAAGTTLDRVGLISTKTRKNARIYGTGAGSYYSIRALTFSQDGKRVAIAFFLGGVKVYPVP